MTVATGARLGSYELITPIGAGGMGEVWKARDPRLSREVAIKLLPHSLTSDPDRLRRFEQEARAAGALNHPNITVVHDVGTHDGAPYLVEELLEGETLRAALAGGRFSPRRAIATAVQIAQGLAAAHARGIVHRDLKPENVFVTRDGRVKILDFGLAKLTRETDAGNVTGLPTETRGTDPGTVMGTLGYMSPEQVRGQASDARSDIFALGAILYEMLAGQRAFRGDSAADTMSAILREDPPDLSVTNKSVPPGLERIVRHCLEKSPEQRFQSARDVAFDLEALSDVSLSAASAGGATPRRALRKLLVPAAAVALFAAGVLADRALVPRHVEPPRITRLTFRRGLVGGARFAPDGQTIVYGASWNGAPFQVFSVRPDSIESRPLGIEGDVLAISGGGDVALSLGRRFTIGWESSGTLARMPLGGGAPREVLEGIQEAEFSPDGKSFVVVRESGGRYRLEYPIGKAIYESDGWISAARLSPGGDRIAFVDHPQRGDNVGTVVEVDASGKLLNRRNRGALGLAWASGGRELWGSGAHDVAAFARSGDPRVMLRLPGAAWLLDVARDGRALVAEADIRREMDWVGGPDARPFPLSWLDWSYPLDVSGDGKTVLFEEQNVISNREYPIYVRRTDGSPAVQLGEGAALALSPDGRWALTVLHPFGEPQMQLLPTGAGQPRTLPLDGVIYARWGRFLPDGKSVIVAGVEKGGHGLRLWVRNLDGTKPRPVTPEGIRARFVPGAVSPDGKAVATAGADGRTVIYPLAGGAPVPVPGVEPGETVIGWTAPNHVLLATSPGLPVKITRVDVTSGRRELVRELAPSDPSGIFVMDPILATRDGSAFVTSYRRIVSSLYLVEGLK